jgi:hypothetical protein
MVIHKKMDRLGKLFFPRNPKMVRYRKMQVVYIAILFSVICCGMVGLLVFLLGRMPG